MMESYLLNDVLPAYPEFRNLVISYLCRYSTREIRYVRYLRLGYEYRMVTGHYRMVGCGRREEEKRRKVGKVSQVRIGKVGR